ncbi:17991_t:CDS:2 [Entrophospora sp. SA101]|nr:17991_t:CDS:2 [Entrophospora sp. SA101]
MSNFEGNSKYFRVTALFEAGNESNSESIDTESDIDPDNYEYYNNHNRRLHRFK